MTGETVMVAGVRRSESSSRVITVLVEASTTRGSSLNVDPILGWMLDGEVWRLPVGDFKDKVG